MTKPRDRNQLLRAEAAARRALADTINQAVLPDDRAEWNRSITAAFEAWRSTAEALEASM